MLSSKALFNVFDSKKFLLKNGEKQPQIFSFFILKTIKSISNHSDHFHLFRAVCTNVNQSWSRIN